MYKLHVSANSGHHQVYYRFTSILFIPFIADDLQNPYSTNKFTVLLLFIYFTPN